MNCYCHPQGNSLEMPSTQTDTPQVLLEGFLQCGDLLWFGSQCFAASVSFLLSKECNEEAAWFI